MKIRPTNTAVGMGSPGLQDFSFSRAQFCPSLMPCHFLHRYLTHLLAVFSQVSLSFRNISPPCLQPPKRPQGPLGKCQTPLFDRLSASSSRIFPTTLPKAAAVSTNASRTFRHLPFGALSFLSRTSFFFTLPQRRTYPSAPAKTTPLAKPLMTL